MQSVSLTLLERLQVISHLRSLQSQTSEKRDPAAPRLAIEVSGERLLTAGANLEEWLMYSGSYNGWRHTSLAEITPENVGALNLRWVRQFNISDQNVDPNIEATPLVVGGAIFMVVDPGHVFALDAKTGAVIWEYKRAIPSRLPIEYPVNRGLAVEGGALFSVAWTGIWSRSMRTTEGSSGKHWWRTPPTAIRLQSPHLW